MNLLELKNIGYRTGGLTVLENISFNLPAGKIVTLIGPNGAGKTTLLKIVLGILSPTAGTLTKKDGLKIGYVPQKLSVPTTVPLTVRRFMALGHRAAEQDILAALRETGAEALVNRSVHPLSGGETQRILLARALMQRPDLLVLDEAGSAWELDMVDKVLLQKAVQARPAAQECVLTAHAAPQWMLDAADYVTEMKCCRHPYQKGIAARKGIEY